MANLRRAFPNYVAGKVAQQPTDKTATLDGSITPTLVGLGKNLEHCTLDAPIVLTCVAVGEVPSKANLDETIVLTSASAVDVVRPGSLDAPIPLTLTGVAAYGQNALLDKPITLTLGAIGKVEIKGRLSATLSTLNPITLNASGEVPNKAQLTGTIPVTLVAQGQLNNAVLAQSITLTLASATETLPRLLGASTIPSFTGDAVLEGPPSNSITLPAFTGNAVVLSERVYNASAILPALIGNASTGHSSTATLPALVGSATLKGGNSLTAITALPALTGDADLIPDSSGYSDTTIPAFTGSSTVVSSSTGIALQILPSVVSDAVLLAGLDSNSSTVLPALTGTAILESDQILVSVTTLPALITTAAMDNGATLTTSTFVFNTENMATTEYSNYDFIAMAMFNGVPVGIGSGGVFELTGADDNGVDIDVNVLSGFDDLGTEDLKRMPNAYVGYKSDGDIQFQVSIDGQPAVRTYRLEKVSNTSGIKRGRAKPAKGLKSRYWQVGVKNVAGSDIELEDLGLYVQQFNRKAQ